jgi:hypothetical protein
LGQFIQDTGVIIIELCELKNILPLEEYLWLTQTKGFKFIGGFKDHNDVLIALQYLWDNILDVIHEVFGLSDYLNNFIALTSYSQGWNC